MKNTLFILLLCTTTVHAQYRNFGIGLNQATNNFSNSYNSTGVSLQYNTRKLLSVRSGLNIEKSTSESSSYYVSTNSNGQSYKHTTTNSFEKTHFSIPLLAELTFGKKMYFSVYTGLVYAALLKNTNVKTTYQTVGINDEFAVSQVNYSTVNVGSRPECDLVYGIAISYPITSRLLLSVEAGGLSYLNRSTLSYDYNIFKGIRFGAGLAYQFNFSKKSSYTFSNNLSFLKSGKGK